MTDLNLKEKCDHGVSMFNPAGCSACDILKAFPVYAASSDDVLDETEYLAVTLVGGAKMLVEPEPLTPPTTKEGNPKDALGIKKVPFSTISSPVLAELGVAMLEGALKYGKFNFRAIGVRGSIYYDAALRHLTSWHEGEDIDPDSGLSHVTKAIASLVVLRDAMINEKFTDDRPPRPPKNWMARLNDKVADLLLRYPNPVNPYTHMDNTWIETTPTTNSN